MLNQIQSRQWILLALGFVIVALVLLPPILPTYFVILLTQFLIFSIVAMSLDLLIGYTALAAVGHGTFFAIGAYTTGVLTTRYGLSFFPCLILAIGLAAFMSALLAFIALRATGIYFLLISLAIAMCIWGVIYQWVSVTGGDNGITDIQRPDFFINLKDNMNYYYFVLVAFIICFSLMSLIIRSPFGRTLVGIRDSALRMQVLGYNIWLHKYLVYVITGAFNGLAGVLWAYFNSYVSPTDGDLTLCFKSVLMVTIGGPGTLIGAGIGAFIITFLENIVSAMLDRYLLIIAFIYIISAMYAPEGILGLLKSLSRRFGNRQVAVVKAEGGLK